MTVLNKEMKENRRVELTIRVERQEWLTAAQCQKLAEALKAMARREAAHEA